MERNRFTRVLSIVLALVLAVVLLVSAISCGQKEEASEKIGVVVSIVPLADFVKNVGGEKVDVSLMVLPGKSPHTYEPTRSQLQAVSEAEMYVKAGSGVEFEITYMDDIISYNTDMLIVDCLKGIELMGTDPHIWNSPVNAKTIVENICEGLIQVDPDNADFYTQNKNDYLKELDILDGYIHYKLDVFTNRTFIIYHPAFGYFADEYNLTQLAVEHEGKEPTPKVILDCIDMAKEYNLQYLFVAPQFATEYCETIASEIGGQTAPMNPLPDNYIANMGRIADSLALEFKE